VPADVLAAQLPPNGDAPNPMLEAALRYAEAGLRVLPLWGLRAGACTCGKPDCDSPGKHPIALLAPQGVYGATTDPATISAWWARFPDANIGVATGASSRVIVLDVDGDEGLQSLARFGGPPDTCVAKTGRGYHYYFRHPGGRVTGFSRRRAGIDLKADGGYVVAPPSRHVSGAQYQWLSQSAELADAPAWLVELSADGRVVGSASPAAQPIAEGQRNATLYGLGRSMRTRSFSPQAIAAALHAENRARCEPPLSEAEVTRLATKAATQADRVDFQPRPLVQPVPASKFAFVHDDEIETQEPPEQLVDGILPAGGFAVLVGAPSSGKTFVALDLAFCVATGNSWDERAVKQGSVLYVAAEGTGGLRARVRAMKQKYAVQDRAGVLFLLQPVQLMNQQEVDDLLAAIGTLPESPSFVIIDTLARCLVGGDENTAKEMGQFVNGVDRIRRETGATVLVVHHSGWERKERLRGSSALQGAADTVMILTSKGDVLTLKCDKQKDAEPFEPIKLRLREVDLGDGEASCVIERLEAISDKGQQALATLRSFGSDGATHAEWMRETKLPKATFNRVRHELVSSGYVEERGKKYRGKSATCSGLVSGLTLVSSVS
jgi:hypothetical protein